MKIIKHTFKFPKLSVIDGDLIEDGFTEETYTFTLLHKGIGLYEELAGKPLVASLLEIRGDEDEVTEDKIQSLFAHDFISNLACASYVVIDGNKFHNNRATAEEFKKTLAYRRCTEDITFVEKLLNMATECIADDTQANVKSKAATKGKNL